VLPIFKDGRRGCFFDAASNATFDASEMVEMIEDVANDSTENAFGAFMFGYPHLLPKMQGEALAHVFSKARNIMQDGGLIVLDLNGVPENRVQTPFGSFCSASMLRSDPVLGPALSHVDILHMNEDELANLTGVKFEGDTHLDTRVLSGAASLFLKCGVAVVAVTRGKLGCFIKCNGEDRFASSKMLPSTWINKEISVDAAWLPHDTVINSNGAGDSFTCGLLVAAMLRHTGIDTTILENPSPVQSPLQKEIPPVELDLSIESFDYV
jgi:sugar/nucleoside kinase (ribokinase family)